MEKTLEPKGRALDWRILVAGALCGALTTFTILAALIWFTATPAAAVAPWDRQLSAATLAADTAAGRVAALGLVDGVSPDPPTSCPSATCRSDDRYLVLAIYNSGERVAVVLPPGADLPDPSAYGPLELFDAGRQNAAMDRFEQAALRYLAAHQP